MAMLDYQRVIASWTGFVLPFQQEGNKSWQNDVDIADIAVNYCQSTRGFMNLSE